ncbi:MAG: cytochrome-c peroxidase [Bacteroidetes bacterium]|nr:cytochrome-c peroxidase [Bacteroidota bacterium]MCL1968762.1 cytochrome-c peroxidase [Bacteroidota bacterium]
MKIKIYFFYILPLLFPLLWLLTGCPKPPEEPFAATPYTLEIPRYFPTNLHIPKENPLTVEGIELGRHLFYDERLCGYLGNNPDSMMSCATCHVQANNFDVGMNNTRFPDGKTFGLSGKPTPHNTMPLMNLVFNREGYFWNGMIHESNPNVLQRSLEDVVLMGIIAPHEMNSTPERAVYALSQNPKYAVLFTKAFGTEEINISRIQKAIAQFIRTLVSGNSKFDRFYCGTEKLTDAEMRGYLLFSTEEGADCFHCHGGDGTPLFTTNLYYNNALSTVFDDSRDRFAFTHNNRDIGAYRAPSLRNIILSPPYMHDGRFKTIDEVLDFYNLGLQNSPYVHPLMHKAEQGGACLTPSQIADLKAFLNTLTDEEFLTNPKFSKP